MHVWTHMDTYMKTSIKTFIHRHIYTNRQTHIQTSTETCKYRFGHLSASKLTQNSVYTWTHIHRHLHAHTYIHRDIQRERERIHEHTQTLAQVDTYTCPDTICFFLHQKSWKYGNKGWKMWFYYNTSLSSQDLWTQISEKGAIFMEI